MSILAIITLVGLVTFILNLLFVNQSSALSGILFVASLTVFLVGLIYGLLGGMILPCKTENIPVALYSVAQTPSTIYVEAKLEDGTSQSFQSNYKQDFDKWSKPNKKAVVVRHYNYFNIQLFDEFKVE